MYAITYFFNFTFKIYNVKLENKLWHLKYIM